MDCPFTRDERTITRLASQSRDCCAYSELIERDAAKCDRLISCTRFWRARGCPRGGRQCVLEELPSPSSVTRAVRRSTEAMERAERASYFREAAEAECRRRMRR